MSITNEKFVFAQPDRFLYHDVKAAVGEVAGVYRLHVLNDQGGFTPIARLLEVDPEGILYLGTAIRVHGRLGELQKALSVAYDRKQWTGSRHGVLSKLGVTPRFVSRFPYERLCVTVQPLAGLSEGNPDAAIDQDHYVQERRLLGEYRQWYGELPPLNAL
jgi:hypothetical protein